MFEEAKAPEAAALAREPPGVAGRAGVGAATPPGASWELNARGRLQAASLSPRNMLFKSCFFFFFLFLRGTELSKLGNSPYTGKDPYNVFLVPFLGKVSPFPQRIKRNWRELEGNQDSRTAVIPCFLPAVQWATFPLTTGDWKP